MTTPNSDGKLLYGKYPVDLSYEVLETVLFWYCSDEELPVPFVFDGFLAGTSAADYRTQKYEVRQKSDLRKIPLNQLINDPRRDFVPEYREKLKERKRQKGILDEFFAVGGCLDPKWNEERIKDKTRYGGKSVAEARLEIERDRKDWSSEQKRVNEWISKLDNLLQGLHLDKYPLSDVPGLIHYCNIMEGPGRHELYVSANDDIITRMIGDGKPVCDKAYTVPEGEVYATVDTTNLYCSSVRPVLAIAGDLATYVLRRQEDRKLKIVKRIVHK